MLTYLCCICDNLYFISLLICIGTGAHIFITNMLEEIESKIDNSCLAFTPYEIKTLYFELVD